MQQDFSDLFKILDFAASGSFEARNGCWGAWRCRRRCRNWRWRAAASGRRRTGSIRSSARVSSILLANTGHWSAMPTSAALAPVIVGKFGYRVVAFDYSEQNFAYDMRFAGPYAGRGFRW